MCKQYYIMMWKKKYIQKTCVQKTAQHFQTIKHIYIHDPWWKSGAFSNIWKSASNPTWHGPSPPPSPCRRLERCCTWKILTLDKTLEGFPPGRCHMLTPFKGTFEDDIMISSYSRRGDMLVPLQAYFLACVFFKGWMPAHIFSLTRSHCRYHLRCQAKIWPTKHT